MEEKNINREKVYTTDEFLNLVREMWPSQRQTELVPLEEAHGRILAEDLFAKYSYPVVRAAAMDGIAVRSADFKDGMPDSSGWVLGIDYVRADTGDDFDDAFDTVIKIENVTLLEGGGVAIEFDEGKPFTPGMFVRPAGSSLMEGSLVAKAGRRINGPLCASIASGGHTQVPVIKQPRVAFIPTGSELVPPSEVPARGENIASNGYAAAALIREYGAIPTVYPIIKDDVEALRAVLDQAIAENDIVVMCGGSAKGSEDFTSMIFSERGRLLGLRVSPTPGRPMAFAIGDGRPLINLSGPTHATVNGLEWCVSALVSHYMGVKPFKRHTVDAVLDCDIKTSRRASRINMLDIYTSEDGQVMAHHTGRHGSLLANGYVRTKMGEPDLKAGQTIKAALLCSAEEIL